MSFQGAKDMTIDAALAAYGAAWAVFYLTPAIIATFRRATRQEQA